MRAFSLLAPAFGVGLAAGWACASRRLRPQAERDGLTGLLRREAFDRRALAALTGASVVGLVDLVDFKGTNDRYGHLVGDQVLRAVAGRLVAALGVGALAGRYGGDEFVLVAPGAGELGERLDRLAAAVGAPLQVAGVGEVPAGVSVGVVRVRDLPAWRADRRRGWRSSLLSEALAHADVAMYGAKAARAPWRVFDPRTEASRPAAQIRHAPGRRYREHGLAALQGSRSLAAGQD